MKTQCEMSLTTESSLQRRDGNSFSCWRRCLFCPCYRRKIAPVNPLPDNSDFMSMGKNGKRVICVVHIDPVLNAGGCLPQESLAPFAKKIVCEDGYESDESNDDYWFSKWSKPLRTVKQFQTEHLRKQNILGLIKSRLPSVRKPKTNPSTNNCDNKVESLKEVPTANFTEDQLSQTVIDQNQEAQSSPPTSAVQEPETGIVNLAFVGSPGDPDAEASTTTASLYRHQTVTKPLLYFIHGAGESSELWKKIMHQFASLNYEVLALDLLGHGFSHTSKLERCYTFKRLLSDVTNVFDAHVSTGRKCVLIGHGYGCSLAVALSRQRSSNITLLALISCGGPTPLAPPVTWRREWKLPSSMLRCLRSLLPCGMRRNVFYGPRGKSCLHDTVYFQSLPTYVRHHLAVGQSWPEGDVAFHRKITVPTLLVHGLKDQHVSLVEMCEMERTIPRAFLEVIPESGHDVMTDVPDQLSKMLRKFVEHWQR